jgi:hypothetical protein
MAEEQAGLLLSLKRADEVGRQFSRLQAIAKDVEARANRAEGRLARGASQITRTAFTTIGNQIIAFSAGEIIGSVVAQQTDSRLFGFLSQVGASTAAGFATGNPIAGISAALTGSISQLFALVKERQQEIEQIKQELKAREERAEEIRLKTLKMIEEMEIRFEKKLEQIAKKSRQDAEEMAWNTYQYL